MNPLIAPAIAQAIAGIIEIWRLHANKPADWIPSEQDWNDLLVFNEKTAEGYKADAAKRLGIEWPPKIEG